MLREMFASGQVLTPFDTINSSMRLLFNPSVFHFFTHGDLNN